MVKAVLIKPLDGLPPGTERDFSADDFRRLEAFGAVRRADGKAAPAVKNKNAPGVANKADPAQGNKAK
ncbi:hypothetical protein [Agrobacterium tumefaciens]|uniref:hypothetical protein n=1 Tax=Agrobacterium tumefaciens TaxID=358 RepID=UPI00157428BA|nr:hypothetical protein [Agrobacterium tumefaciens]NTA42648.1 hypothetical protein [Agrobacterium tumefaciens]NTD84287.1 hypothetical protein [Agrobacterium tumefaciens]NTD94603.1 hypothetical protein [Agrobacterium tumefaciens]NTD96054.1 hypothetical protein [Agrobacterium tumefaciens]NTE13913.1 hypothetical protein [Agrobacterium tumefaciens]